MGAKMPFSLNCIKMITQIELPQYFVEGTHEAIIDMETFQYVQAEMQRRRELGALANKSLNTCCFTGKLKCPFCGQSYMHNTRTDRGNFQEFWSCGNMKKKGGRCPVGGSINHTILQRWQSLKTLRRS